MEQVESVSFSSVLATLLLSKARVSAFDIVNFISKISQGDGKIIYNVEDDSIDYLFVCIDSLIDGGFKIKDTMDYNTVLYDGVTVFDFLKKNSLNDSVKSFLFDDKSVNSFENLNKGNFENMKFASNFSEIFVPKKRVRTLFTLKRI